MAESNPNTALPNAKIAIIGGSGLYSLFEEGAQEVEIQTKYGSPSDKISVGKINGKEVAFLPRHGIKHTIPPHKINYKANIEALAQLGVERIISTTAVGSLSADIDPGMFVFPDQFINFTHRSEETFFDGPEVAHISTADPYCDEIRSVAIDDSDTININYLDRATLVTINGPRFSTKSESKMFRSLGGDIINMTQYPEITLAREKAMCYFSIAIVTDYDSGLEGREDISPVTTDDVNKKFAESIKNLRLLLNSLAKDIPEKRSCTCSHVLDNAFMTKM